MKKLSKFINDNYKVLFNSSCSHFVKNSVFTIKYEDFINNNIEILNKAMNDIKLQYLFNEGHDFWDFSFKWLILMK